MGVRFLDQFSLLHYSVGVIMYFWGFRFLTGVLLHTLFEIVENTSVGIRFINTHLAGVWPGGKPCADQFSNMVGDTGAFVLGWLCAFALDAWGVSAQWYTYHRT